MDLGRPTDVELLCKSPKKPLSSGAHRTAQGLGKKKRREKGKELVDVREL